MPAPIVDVEVRFGASVVDRRRLVVAGPDRARPWFVVGALGALVVGACLAAGVLVAARDQARREVWIDQLHRPPHAFRPTRLPRALDATLLCGAAAALLGLVGGLRARVRRPRHQFIIGTEPAADLAVATAAVPTFPLVEAVGGGALVRVHRGLVGWLHQDGEVIALAELRRRGLARGSAIALGVLDVVVPVGAVVVVELGAVQAVITPASPDPDRYTASLVAALGLDRRLVAALAATSVGVTGLAALAPGPRQEAWLAMVADDERPRSTLAAAGSGAATVTRPASAEADPFASPPMTALILPRVPGTSADTATLVPAPAPTRAGRRPSPAEASTAGILEVLAAPGGNPLLALAGPSKQDMTAAFVGATLDEHVRAGTDVGVGLGAAVVFKPAERAGWGTIATGRYRTLPPCPRGWVRSRYSATEPGPCVVPARHPAKPVSGLLSADD